MNYESYGFISRREGLSITVSSFCVFISSRPWRLPGHLLQKTSFQLLTTLSVWNHQFLYKASTGYSIWKSCSHQTQRSFQHSELFILLRLKTVMLSCFWRSSLTRKWPFVTSMLFTFSRKNFGNLVKFYFLENVIFHIMKSLLLTIESSKDSLFTGQLFQRIKLKNSQEYQED